MGLDMYLEAKYKPNYKRKIKLDLTEVPKEDLAHQINFDSDRISSITMEVAYWRKFNALHGWFVKNIQNGEDDCNTYVVELEVLEELITTLNRLNKSDKDEDMAVELFPATSGFFFGEDSHDDYFWSEVKRTAQILNTIKAKGSIWSDRDYYYRSSW